jgi:hypothetical protein
VYPLSRDARMVARFHRLDLNVTSNRLLVRSPNRAARTPFPSRQGSLMGAARKGVHQGMGLPPEETGGCKNLEFLALLILSQTPLRLVNV